MQRFLFATVLMMPFIAGCATPFKDRRTPSGEFCSDMHVVPAGQSPDREYHRLQPVSSDPEARTEAQRLESLRKAACGVGADAVIEAVNEEVRMPDAGYATISSGTAVIWLRRDEIAAKPVSDYRPPTPPTETAAPVEPPPEAAPSAAPSAAPTTSAKAVPTAAPSAKPFKSLPKK